MYKNNRQNLLIKVYDLLTVLVESWLKPVIWRYHLRKSSVPVLLGEIEERMEQVRPLSLSPNTIGYLVRRRTVLTIRWRRTRCLLSSMLLLYFLVRTQRVVTMHFECNIEDNNRLMGHCWISSPDLNINKKFIPSEGKDEIYCKTVFPKKSYDSLHIQNCNDIESKPTQNTKRDDIRNAASMLNRFHSRLNSTKRIFTRKLYRYDIS